MTSSAFAPPRSIEELVSRARSLEGLSLEALAERAGVDLGGPTLRRKGKAGVLLERVLGASAGSAALPDFPDLGVELKSVPTDLQGKPRESTFVTSIDLATADSEEWETSRARLKLAHVLFIPVRTPTRDAMPSASFIGRPVLFSPTEEEERVLRDDFEAAMSLLATGRVDDVTAHLGVAMQVRPKARDGSVRTRAIDADSGWTTANPRGFYLRASFVERLLDPRRSI